MPCFRCSLATTSSETSPYSISPSDNSSLFTFARIVAKPTTSSFSSPTRTLPSHFVQRFSICAIKSSTIAAPDGRRWSSERSKSCNSIRHARTPAKCAFSSNSRIRINAVCSIVWRSLQVNVNRLFARHMIALSHRRKV